MKLNPPFDTFRIEKYAGEYKDFGLPPESTYPLRGVHYAVDYGDIEGYVGEDGANLDIFVGQGTVNGFFRVFRPELPDGEHKFYVGLSEDEEKSVLAEFGPVIIEQGRFERYDEFLAAIEKFKVRVTEGS